jgi:hypothetical protein
VKCVFHSRKAEKKQLKAIKKEQKKLQQESQPSVESVTVNTNVPPSNSSDQAQSSIHNLPHNPVKDSSGQLPSIGNPVGNPHGQSDEQESIHPPSRESEYHHDKNVRDNQEFETYKEFANPHSGEQRMTYGNPKEHTIEETREHRENWVARDDRELYSNPRIRELRDNSPSRLSQRQSEHLPHQDYIHRGEDRDSYDHYSGVHTSRTSHEDFHEEKNFTSRSRYEQPDDYRHNAPREYDDRHGPHYNSEYDDRRDRDYRYSTDRRDPERFRNSGSYDHFKRGRTRMDDHEYHGTSRSHEDLSYLDRSYEGHYDPGRPERSSREELESYNTRNNYMRDNNGREGFKPITDPHYPEYREPYRSNTPSSSSGHSSPTAYNYHHDPYYGYHPQHPYPGYDHHYGHYQGPYGAPYHGYPGYYPGYGPYYDYYNQYGQFGSGQGGQYSSGEGGFQDNQANEPHEEPVIEKDQQGMLTFIHL